MEDALQQIGLTAKEAKLYLLLLKEGNLTATVLAERAGEKRTNTYMILDSLVAKGVVTSDDSQPTRQFGAADPAKLSQLREAEQVRQRQASAALNAAMPQIKSMYALLNNRPGIVHLAGLEGYKTILEDMKRSTTEVLLVASDAPTGGEVWEVLAPSLAERKTLGVVTRALYHRSAESGSKKIFAERGLEVRFLGDQPFPAEMEIYEDNVVFRSYSPSLVSTVLTNASIADTMRLLFESLWSAAE